MARLRGVSLVDQAEEEISRLIDTGVFPSGERLSIAQVAKRFGTSVVPVREAMARLHSRKVLTFEPNKGYSVAPRLGEMEISRMMDARLALELGALEVGFQNVSAADADELRAINQEIRDCNFSQTIEDYRDFVRLNERFHTRLMRIADNEFLMDAYDAIGYHTRITRAMQDRGVRDIPTLIDEHDAIVAALEARDIAACRDRLRAHIVDAYSRVRAAGLTRDG